MIRWCAYCQRYVDEVPPWHDYSLSHVLCDSCVERAGDPALIRTAKAMVRLYDRVREAARSYDTLKAARVMDECVALGIRPVDMMMGIIQPILYEIGDLFAQSQMTVAGEHQFTGFATSLLSLAFGRHPDLSAYRQSAHPRMLLTNAEGNVHVLGVQILEFYLAAARVPTFTLLPGTPAADILSVVQRLHPPFVGVSVALGEQMASVRQLAALLETLSAGERPRLIVGGSFVRDGLDAGQSAEFEICRNAGELKAAGVTSE
jgi:methanogenic corrinoid protein MtbC1